MGYKAQVVASAIALPILRKIENGGQSTARTVDFRGLKPPRTVVNQGGYWLRFVEGNESFKMVVVASKNSTGVSRNRPRKMGGRGGFPSFYVIGPLCLKFDWATSLKELN
ncbi:hypothetical protein DVH24_032751 [Malus domestica]|uniref:Uncharacterized protein n=1 Tax=Malus domestica TaxID=3750 RepID=A0A498ILN6_MALDO|nr:hypothetical protein DVH24_032751 [Malus domestica]